MCSSISATTPSIYDCEGYRLPTEAEWEYACRAGTTTALYTGGVIVGPKPSDCIFDPALDRAGWYCANSGFRTHVVGGKEANSFGLFDMHGNAAEWVEDRFDGLGYGPDPAVDPDGLLVATQERVLRGGFVTAFPTVCRCAHRFDVNDIPVNYSGVGLRLVRTRGRQ
jgi:formylglycine-generating enzyme required for sulfatase activity